MSMRNLIINADGYGMSDGTNRAIEECIAWGTVSSVSVNVNLPSAAGLPHLLGRFPHISVGCHLNPVVGPPVLPASRVPSLLNEHGQFHYHDFDHCLLSGRIRATELEAELAAQVERCRQLANGRLSHIDCHMGKHRLPQFYPVFLRVVKQSGVRRIRTHRYMMGMESTHRRLSVARYYARHPQRIVVYAWNIWLRYLARQQGLSMPDWWAAICDMEVKPNGISVQTWSTMLANVREGFSEFVVHPAYVDDGLQTWSTYLHQRDQEREVLCSHEFRRSLCWSGVRLSSYLDIPA